MKITIRKTPATRVKVLLLFALSCISYSLYAELERSKVDEQYRWNLSDIYSSQQAWHQHKKEVSDQIGQIKHFKSKLSNSGKTLKKALDTYYQTHQALAKLNTYAYMLSDQDTREPAPLAMKQESQQLYTQLQTAAAFIDPEILNIPTQTIERFYRTTPSLKTYAHIIDNIQRKRAHTLDEQQEKLIAEVGLLSSTAQDTYTILSNADLPRPTVTLSNGKEIRLDSAGYAQGRVAKNRQDRIKVFNAFFGALSKFERTFGTQLYGEIKKNIFYKNVRNYTSSLEMSLDHSNIPTSVYHKLIENTNKHLGTLHRYLKLRKKLMGLDTLHYYDLYPPVVDDVNLNYRYEEAVDISKKALSVLGKEYIAVMDKAVAERWVDVMPTTGKRSGAYANGSAYDVHPYMLVNFNGNYNDMSLVAHEFGHVMHSYFSNKQQPYHLSGYPTFLAEVASTANESILINHMLKSIKKRNERLALLATHLDGFKNTLFRQTQFAEFELKIHELAEKGEALTGERFSEIYLKILRKYYGHDQGVCTIDPLFAIEWAYIPHFYYNFYVYQYSTSYTAAQALANKMLSGDQKMVEQYLQFLSSGGSDYAIPTLKKVGIDMTSDEPFTLAIKNMNKVMDEIDQILLSSD